MSFTQFIHISYMNQYAGPEPSEFSVLTALTLNHVDQLNDYKCQDGNSFPIALLKKTLYWTHLQLPVLADRKTRKKNLKCVVLHICSLEMKIGLKCTGFYVHFKQLSFYQYNSNVIYKECDVGVRLKQWRVMFYTGCVVGCGVYERSTLLAQPSSLHPQADFFKITRISSVYIFKSLALHCAFSDMKMRWQHTGHQSRKRDNYKATCNQGGPWQAEWGLMSQRVTPELQGSTANQPPRRGLRGAITQAPHHHAGRKAITGPFPCAAIPTHPPPYLQLSNQGAQTTREALDGGKGDWWVQSNEV